MSEVNCFSVGYEAAEKLLAEAITSEHSLDVGYADVYKMKHETHGDCTLVLSTMGQSIVLLDAR